MNTETGGVQPQLYPKVTLGGTEEACRQSKCPIRDALVILPEVELSIDTILTELASKEKSFEEGTLSKP